MNRNVLVKGTPDKRLVHRRMLKGEVTEDDLREFLSDLPDVSENAEEIHVTPEDPGKVPAKDQ